MKWPGSYSWRYPFLLAVCLLPVAAAAEQLIDAPARRSITKVAKLYGAGGLGGLESYQTALLISEEGHLVTANSLVLDQGVVTVVLDSGNRYSGQVLGADPVANVAVVKIDPAGETLPCFSLPNAPVASAGESILILSNQFGIAAGNEPVSLLHSVVSAVAPLRAQRGQLERVDGGDVYILDAVTSNPGAAGGAVVDHQGRLLGMLGSELKSRVTGAWFSHALPAAELRISVDRIVQGHASAGAGPSSNDPVNYDLLKRYGFRLAPEIVARTPPYVDYVQKDSLASKAGIRPDDLLVTVNGLITGSVVEVRRVFAQLESEESLSLFVQRGEEYLELQLKAPGEGK